MENISGNSSTSLKNVSENNDEIIDEGKVKVTIVAIENNPIFNKRLSEQGISGLNISTVIESKTNIDKISIQNIDKSSQIDSAIRSNDRSAGSLSLHHQYNLRPRKSEPTPRVRIIEHPKAEKTVSKIIAKPIVNGMKSRVNVAIKKEFSQPTLDINTILVQLNAGRVRIVPQNNNNNKLNNQSLEINNNNGTPPVDRIRLNNPAAAEPLKDDYTGLDICLNLRRNGNLEFIRYLNRETITLEENTRDVLGPILTSQYIKESWASSITGKSGVELVAPGFQFGTYLSRNRVPISEFISLPSYEYIFKGITHLNLRGVKDPVLYTHVCTLLTNSMEFEKFFPNVTELQLPETFNSEIPHQILVKLTSLRMGRFYNKPLPRSLPSLRSLTTGWSYLRPLPLQLPNLEFLETGECFIEALPQNLPKLQTFKRHALWDGFQKDPRFPPQ